MSLEAKPGSPEACKVCLNTCQVRLVSELEINSIAKELKKRLRAKRFDQLVVHPVLVIASEDPLQKDICE